MGSAYEGSDDDDGDDDDQCDDQEEPVVAIRDPLITKIGVICQCKVFAFKELVRSFSMPNDKPNLRFYEKQDSEFAKRSPLASGP